MRRRTRRAAAAAAVLLLPPLAPALPILALRWLPPPTTAFMLRQPGPVRYRFVPWREISPHVAIAVVAAEDQKFPRHHGFDFASIRSALSEPERRRGRGPRGASTLTQQVAKNLFLWPGRNVVRKALEAGLTVWIEALWPKRRILEVYLNVAEFGPGVFGVAAASEAYFGVPPARLDPAQAARLAAVLPDPRRIRVADPGPWARERAAEIEALAASLGGPAYLRGL